jgi:phosphoribosylanthranilate isomerase
MTKIKVCGLFRPCDADFANRAMPDYAGLVFCEKSRRNVSPGRARALRAKIDPAIRVVGVFVDAPIGDIARFHREGIFEIVQLHGSEDAGYIARLRAAIPGAEIWKVYKIRTSADLGEAAESKADLVLLDGGAGAGARFDWELIRAFPRPFILAGGLTPENIPEALALHPCAVDLSSGVEKDGDKNEVLIRAAVAAARGL